MFYVRILLRLVYLILFISLTNGQIVNKLWNMEFIGKPHSMKFVNDKEILISSNRGVYSKINLNGDEVWKKNLIYKEEIEVDSIGQYGLLVNKKNGFLDLININSSQLIWSIDFQKNKDVRWNLINENNNFVCVVMQKKEIKVLNKKEIISEIKARTNEEYLDSFVNSEKEILIYASLIDNKQLEIIEVNLAKNSNKSSKQVFSIDISINIKFTHTTKLYITKSFVYLLTDEGHYIIINYIIAEPTVVTGSIDFKISENSKIEKFNSSDKIVFLDNIIKILSLKTNTFNSVQLETKNEFTFDKIDNFNQSSLFIFRQKNANTYLTSQLNLSNDELTQFSSNTINLNVDEDLKIEKFIINPYNTDTFLFTTKENKLFILKKDSSKVKKIDNSLSGVSFVELVGYYNEQGKEFEKHHYHNNLDHVLNQKEIPNIFSNLLKSIYDDVLELSSKVKSNIVNLIENRGETITESKTKHYLIAFSEVSQELFIINALDGLVIINKQFMNKSIHSVIKNTKEDLNKNENKFIFIIMIDRLSGNFSSLKFNLESTELSEDQTAISELLLIEEIKNQCESLVKNSVQSPLTLTMSLQKSIIDKYDNKFTIEFDKNNLFGIKFKKSNNNNKLNVSVAWNHVLKPDSTFVQQKLPNIHSNLITTYHVLGKVFYKYIDANILLLLSNIDNKTLLVSLIKTNSGKLLHQSYISNVDFTQNVYSVFEENIIVISYVKKEKHLSRTEVYAIEIMKREIEHSFINLLEKIFKINILGNNDFKEDIINESIQESDLIFLAQTFILSRKIKGLFMSKSQLNVANKYLMFLFENNQVFLLDKRIISPRRPLMKEDKNKQATPVLDPLNSPYIDPELSPYQPIINFDFKQILNMNFADDQIDNILVAPTQYESTYLICTEGLNLACYKVFPDKTFDTLNVTFSYSVIALFLIGIIVLTYLLRKYVKKTEIKTAFMSS